MRETFPAYQRRTPEELRALWNDAIFAFDSNVLLDCYRYSEDTAEELFSVWEALGERIVVPHRAALEFYRNRIGVMEEARSVYDDVRTKWVALQRTLKQNHRHARHLNLPALLEEAGAVVEEHVAAAEERHSNDHETDRIADRIEDLFAGRVGPKYDVTEEVRTEAQRRIDARIPPGYMDDKKSKLRDERYGDVIVWFELLNLMKERQKPLIFVTRDKKDDWWMRSSGETRGPRPELIEEMHSVAGVAFHMYTPHRFLEFAKSLDVGSRVTEAALLEVEGVSREAALRAVRAVKRNAERNLREEKDLLTRLFGQLNARQAAVEEALAPSLEEWAGVEMAQAPYRAQRAAIEEAQAPYRAQRAAIEEAQAPYRAQRQADTPPEAHGGGEEE